MPDSLWNKTWLRLRYYRAGLPWYGFVAQMLIDVAAKFGMRIEPYHLFMEGLGNGRIPNAPTGLEGHEIGFLEASDMRSIAGIPGRNFSNEDLVRRLQENMRCLGIKHRGEIVAFTWFNLEACTFESQRLFSLRENEAHLFDAYTAESFRGKSLAPYMRYRCYEELAKLGRTRCYSFTAVFNTPAVRFKQKLGAQVLELRMLVELLQRWRFHARLKSYPAPAVIGAGKI